MSLLRDVSHVGIGRLRAEVVSIAGSFVSPVLALTAGIFSNGGTSETGDRPAPAVESILVSFTMRHVTILVLKIILVLVGVRSRCNAVGLPIRILFQRFAVVLISRIGGAIGSPTLPPRSKFEKLRREEQRSLLVRYLRWYPAEYERVVTNGLRSDRSIARAVSTSWDGSLSHFNDGSRWRNDKQIALDLVSRPPRLGFRDWRLHRVGLGFCNLVFATMELEHASERLKGDRDVVLASVRAYPEAILHVAASVTDDDEVILAAVGAKLRTSSLVWDNLCCKRRRPSRPSCIVDLDPVAFHIQQPTWLRHASKRIKNEFNIGCACVRSGAFLECPWAAMDIFRNALGDSLKDNLEIASLVIQKYPRFLKYAGPSVRDDFDLVLSAVSHDSIFQYRTGRWDRDVYYASQTFPCPRITNLRDPIFQYASERLRGDRTYVVIRINMFIMYSVGTELVGRGACPGRGVNELGCDGGGPRVAFPRTSSPGYTHHVVSLSRLRSGRIAVHVVGSTLLWSYKWTRR